MNNGIVKEHIIEITQVLKGYVSINAFDTITAKTIAEKRFSTNGETLPKMESGEPLTFRLSGEACDDCGVVYNIDNLKCVSRDDIPNEEAYDGYDVVVEQVCQACVKNYIMCEHCEYYFAHDKITQTDGVDYCIYCDEYLKTTPARS